MTKIKPFWFHHSSSSLIIPEAMKPIKTPVKKGNLVVMSSDTVIDGSFYDYSIRALQQANIPLERISPSSELSTDVVMSAISELENNINSKKNN